MAVETTLTGENQFSPALSLQARTYSFNVSVRGTFVATVTVQRSFDRQATWGDVKGYTVPAEEVGEDFEQMVDYRIGIKTGDYTSGSVDVRIGQLIAHGA